MKRFIGCTAAAFFAMIDAASARPGCVYRDAHLRVGPGGAYPLIGTIPGPTPVVLVRLGRDWGIISYDGDTGYVATRHLTPNSATPPDPMSNESLRPSTAALIFSVYLSSLLTDGNKGGMLDVSLDRFA